MKKLISVTALAALFTVGLMVPAAKADCAADVEAAKQKVPTITNPLFHKSGKKKKAEELLEQATAAAENGKKKKCKKKLNIAQKIIANFE